MQQQTTVRIVPRNFWVNSLTTQSIPHISRDDLPPYDLNDASERDQWEIVQRGYTVRIHFNNGRVQFGSGTAPFRCMTEAKNWCDTFCSANNAIVVN